MLYVYICVCIGTALADLYKDLVHKYPIISIEDPFEQVYKRVVCVYVCAYTYVYVFIHVHAYSVYSKLLSKYTVET